MRRIDRDRVILNFDSSDAQNAHRAHGVILNTFNVVEQDIFDALRHIFPGVYTVSPL
jgi:hypothetical protein